MHLDNTLTRTLFSETCPEGHFGAPYRRDYGSPGKRGMCDDWKHFCADWKQIFIRRYSFFRFKIGIIYSDTLTDTITRLPRYCDSPHSQSITIPGRPPGARVPATARKKKGASIMQQVAYTNHIGRAEHDGKAKDTSISTSADLANTEKHNNHDYTQDEVARMESAINLELKSFNKQYDENLQEVEYLDLVANVKKIYHQEFDAAVAEYNAKQARKDRCIEDYYEKVSGDGKLELAVEGIIQIGEMMDWKEMSLQDKAKTLPIYLDCLKEMQKEIPGLIIAGSSFHINEQSPHLHWVGVCVDPKERKRGLRKQVGKSAVFTQDVLGDLMQTKLRERMEKQVKEVFGWEFKEKKSGRNEDLTKNELINKQLQEKKKELMHDNKELQDEQTMLQEENIALSGRKNELNDQVKKIEETLKIKEDRSAELDAEIENRNMRLDEMETKIELAEKLLSKLQENHTRTKQEIGSELEEIQRTATTVIENIEKAKPEKPVSENDISLVIWCMNNIKGVADKIIAWCKDLYKKRTEALEKATRDVQERKSGLDSMIDTAKDRIDSKPYLGANSRPEKETER